MATPGKIRVRWLVPLLTVALGAAAVIWTNLERMRVRRELDRIFEEHVHSVARLIWESTREATRTVDMVYRLSEEVLASNAGLVAGAISQGATGADRLRSAGVLVWLTRNSSGSFDGEWGPLEAAEREAFVADMQSAAVGEIVESGAALRHGLYCARLEPEGVATVVCQDAEELVRLRRQSGLGSLLREVSDRGVVYAAIQDETGILASSPGAALSAWETDADLADARNNPPTEISFRLLTGESTLFEGLAPFHLPDGTTAVLRVGVDASHLTAIQQDIAWRHRLLYLAVGLLVLISVVGAWMAGRWSDRRERVERRLAAREEESRHWQTIGQMASSVAHEVRNPLNTLKMAAQRLKKEFSITESDRPEYDKLIALLDSEAERVNRVVSEFLQLGRPLQLAPESLPVGKVLEEALLPLRIRAEKENIRLHCEPAGDGSIRLDRGRFSQVVANLVGNAFDAVGPDGEVRVTIRLDSAGLRLAVRDNGAGMDSETLERVQRPFVTTKARGTGLGLSIARRLVEAHGGELQLSSVPGKGTEARVFLPRSGPATED